MKRWLAVFILVCIFAGILVPGVILNWIRHERDFAVEATVPKKTEILNEAYSKTSNVFEITNEQSREKAKVLAILAVAEQLGRIADALENIDPLEKG